MRFALLLLCLIAGFAHGQEIDPRVHLETAMHVQGEDPSYAIELYSEVLELSTDDADRYVAALNRGALILDSEEPDLVLAADSLRIAGRYAVDAEQRRGAMFSLGLALHRGVDSSGQLMMDPEQIGKMIEQLRVVERAFLSAARADIAHMESKRNVERLRVQIQQLEDMKEQIEQQQQDQQQQGEDGEQSGGEGEQQDMADQLQDLADQQREQAQQSESASQGDQNDQQQRSEQQEELSEQTEQANEQVEQSQDTDQETQQDLQDAMDAQQEAEEALERGDNETAAEKQQEAADALERAAQRVRESQQEQESEQQQGQQPGQPQEDVGEDGEPIDELAQQLLDKERDERERRQVYRATGRPVRVKEDW
jgi:hypothetical protein